MRFTHILHILICVVNLFCSILGWKIIENNEFYDKNKRNYTNSQLTVGYLMLFRNTAIYQFWIFVT